MVGRCSPSLIVAALVAALLVASATASPARHRLSAVAELEQVGFHTVTDGTGSDAQTYTVPSTFVTDGVRYALFATGEGLLKIYDSKSNLLSEPITTDPRCGGVVASGGLAVISCEPDNVQLATEPSPSVLNLASHALHPVPGHFAGGDHPIAVGRYWIQIMGCGGPKPDFCINFYVNWLTGHRLSPPGQRNLDSPRLAATATPSTYLFSRHFTELWLRQGHRRIRLSRCRPRCDGPALSAGRVTWTEGLNLHVYGLRSRHHLVIPASPCSETTGAAAAQTYYRLLVIQCDGRQPRGRALFQTPW